MNKLREETEVATGSIVQLRERLPQENLIDDIGIEVVQVGHGWAETLLTPGPKHLRADGTIHSGIISVMLEYTAELAGITLVDSDEFVRIVEIKANLLRPARGNKLRCRSQVVRQGSMILGVGSEVFAHSQRQKSLVARALVTLSITTNDE